MCTNPFDCAYVRVYIWLSGCTHICRSPKPSWVGHTRIQRTTNNILAFCSHGDNGGLKRLNKIMRKRYTSFTKLQYFTTTGFEDSSKGTVASHMKSSV
jgi:hypothetical protein